MPLMIPNRGGFRKGETAYAFNRSTGSVSSTQPLNFDFTSPPEQLLQASHFVAKFRIVGQAQAGGVDHFLDSPIYSFDQEIEVGTDILDEEGNPISVTGTPYTSLADMIGKPGAEGGCHFDYKKQAGTAGDGGILFDLNCDLKNAARYESEGNWGISLSLNITIYLEEDPDDPVSPPYDPPGALFETQSGATDWNIGNDTTSVTFDGLPVALNKTQEQTLSIEITILELFGMETPA